MLSIENKLKAFEIICGNWDYRNIDMTEPHLQSIQIIGNDILISCELFSPEIDDYVSCDGGIISDKNLVKKFNDLDLTNRKNVLGFIADIETHINWDKVNKDLYDEIEKEINNIKEKKENRNIKILGTWGTDYDDIRCKAILYQDEKEVANIIASYDEADIRYSIGDKDTELNDDFVRKAFKSLIYDDFDSYLKLPKISECSKLLQNIYDDVCANDSSMCHISDDDWNDFYIDDYTDKDFEYLKVEVEKYGLQDIIGINDGEYKIIGYGDLETRFNDDRNLEISKESEIEL